MADPFKLADLSPGSPHIYVYAANYQYARNVQRKRITGGGPTYTSWGKGDTRAQAEASARGEAIEHLSSFYTGEESSILTRAKDLGERAIEPNACMLYSDMQFVSKDPKGPELAGLYVPEPFDSADEIAWTAVKSLTTHEKKYIPTAYCYFKCPVPGKAYCVMDSNGHAAGNSLEEAALGGLLELIERDAVGIWWYNNLPANQVDLASFDNPYFKAVEDYYARLKQDVYVLDITSDIDIPVYVAVTCGRSNRNKIRMGYGAGPNAEVAIQRALSELHMWFVFPDERYESPSPQIHPWAYKGRDGTTIEISDLQCLSAQAPLPVKTAADYTEDFTEDLEYTFALCKQKVENQGMEILILNQTRVEYGLTAVKVIVPGLRHYKRRLAKGRLYDVPVKLNRISTPHTEDIAESLFTCKLSIFLKAITL